MADVYSKKKRSEIMSAIKGGGTKLEKDMARTLKTAGIKFRSHPRGLPGNPDFFLTETDTVVFVDSCFWHGCRYHGSMPKSNTSFWRKKIARNKSRDRAVSRIYRKTPYRAVRVWEHQLRARDTNTRRRLLAKLGDKMEAL